jgi:hypothetical protein
MKIEEGHAHIQNNYLGLTNLGCEKDIIKISPFILRSDSSLSEIERKGIIKWEGVKVTGRHERINLWPTRKRTGCHKTHI